MANQQHPVSADHLWAGLLNGAIFILLGSLFPIASLWFLGEAVTHGLHLGREGAPTVLRDAAIVIVLLTLSAFAIVRGVKILRLNLKALRGRA